MLSVGGGGNFQFPPVCSHPASLADGEGLNRAGGEHIRGPLQHLLQLGPNEAAARVLLASRGDMFMPRNMADGVMALDALTHLCERGILCGFERQALQALQFDSDGVIIAALASLPTGGPCVPGTIIAADELPDGAGTGDKEVR